MRSWTAIAHVWPGLPQVWRRGSWSALGAATFFSLLVNATLLVHFIHPERFSVSLRGLVCAGLAVFWAASVRYVWRQSRRVYEPQDAAHEGLFLQAQAEYLRGNWSESEALARSLLGSVAEDLEARLLLIAVLRRTGRVREAHRELRHLARLPGAERWSWELARERARLDEHGGAVRLPFVTGDAQRRHAADDDHDEGPLQKAA